MAPDQVALAKAQSSIPSEVVDALNECLAKCYDPKLTVIMQADLVEAIINRMPGLTERDLINRDWLDFEPLYRARGWNVAYVGDPTGRHWVFQPLEKHERVRQG